MSSSLMKTIEDQSTEIALLFLHHRHGLFELDNNDATIVQCFVRMGEKYFFNCTP